MSKRCDFAENHNMLRDKIVSAAIKGRLLKEKDLNLTKAIDICLVTEIALRELCSTKSQMEPTAVSRVIYLMKLRPQQRV